MNSATRRNKNSTGTIIDHIISNIPNIKFNIRIQDEPSLDHKLLSSIKNSTKVKIKYKKTEIKVLNDSEFYNVIENSIKNNSIE